MMKKRLITALVALLATGALHAQQGFSSIEERMTGKEFTAAGLDKLSPEELTALNEWLRSHSVATLEDTNQDYSDARGFETQAMKGMDDKDVVSRIMGDFNGWSGKTVFKLENGMVWEQDEPGTFYIPSTNDAVAVIDKGMFNTWRLKVQGYGTSVKVKRVE